MAQAADAVLRLSRNTLNGADIERKFAASRWTHSANNAVRSGIVPVPGGGVVTVTGAAGSEVWNFTPVPVVLADGAAGCYEATFAVNKSEAMPARPSTGLSRYDVLLLEATDTGSHYVQLRLLSGTAGSSPSIPSTPAGAIAVATIQAFSGSAPTIVQRPPRTGPSGTPVRVYDAADLATLGPVDGDMAYQEDIDVYLSRINGAWKAGFGGMQAAVVNGLSLTTTTQSLGSVTLLPGTWTLIAKGYFEWSIGSTNSRTATMELFNSTSSAQLDSIRFQYPTLGGYSPFSLLSTITVTAPTTVALRGLIQTTDGTQLISVPKFTAIPG